MPFIENQIPDCAYYFIHIEKEILLTSNNQLPSKSDFMKVQKIFPAAQIFTDTDNNYCAMDINLPISQAQQVLTPELHHEPLRNFFFTSSPELTAISARSRTISKWLKLMKYCPGCGSSLTLSKTLNCKKCSDCNQEYFPRIEPAVIVLIQKEDKILLARHTQRNQEMWACIAGFVEAGESLEQAVEREIKEETDLQVTDIKYKGSQGWPFPDQLMLAFTAQWKSGEIKLQEQELQEARWFNKNELPSIPPKGSIAYRLINDLF